MKTVRSLACALLLSIPSMLMAQATIPVTGQKVLDNNLVPLTGQLLFTVTDGNDAPITYTPQGGSPTAASIAIPVVAGKVQNVGGFPAQIPNPVTMTPANSFYRMRVQTTGGATTIFTFPLVGITQAFFSYDGYSVPANVTASGIGIPKVPCSPKATYNNLSTSDPYPWVCSQFTGDSSVYWTQNPSLNPACQRGNNQAIASSLSGSLFCVDSTQAFVTPGFVYAGPPTANRPQAIGLVPIATLCSGGVCGSGSNPAGQIFEVQSNKNNALFDGSGLFTNTAHSYLFTPAPQFAQYARNSPILSYCAFRQCGSIKIYSQDIPTLSPVSSVLTPTGLGQSFFTHDQSLFTGLGLYNANVVGNLETPGTGVMKMYDDFSVFHTTAITQSHSGVTICGKSGDCADNYHYVYCHGGFRYSSDEGCDGGKWNGGNAFNRQGGAIISGNPGTGAETITVSQYFNPDDIMVGQGNFVINQSTGPSTSGNLIAYDQPNHLLQVTPGSVTVPFATGTTVANIVIAQSTVFGTTANFDVHVDATSAADFPTGTTILVYLGCSNPEIESVKVTATAKNGSGNQTLTGIVGVDGVLYHGHPLGCKVAYGGTTGILDLFVDRIGNNWRTSYFVFAAPDTSHIYERTYVSSTLGVINAWKHQFGGGFNHITNALISGNGTTTTACGLGPSQYVFGAGNQYVKISGATPSTFNATYIASAINANNCITMAGSGNGNAVGAVIDTGGDVNSPDYTPGPPQTGTFGTGGFYIWPAAMLKQIITTPTTDANGITTNTYLNATGQGTLSLYPNDLTFTNGQLLQSLDDMQSKIGMLSAYGSDDIVPNGSFVNWVTSRSSGEGVSGPNFRFFTIQNDNNFNKYQGGGGNGTLVGPTGLNIGGPFARPVVMSAPLAQGKAIEILSNPPIAAGLGNNNYYVLAADSPGGNPGFFITLNPNTGVSSIGSGLGTGVYSTISLDPANIKLASTGDFAVQSTTVHFTDLAGTGSRCLQADTTGGVTATTACSTLSSLTMTMPGWATVNGSTSATLSSSGTFTLALPTFGGSGTSHAPGIVPDPGGVVGTARYLNEGGGFVDPLAGGLGTTFTITTPTGTCNFTYTKGNLTAKTGSC